MNGAPSVQMQEIPPDLMGWMEEEERNAEEKEDEVEGNGTEKGRSDGHRKRNDFFDGEKDGEADVDRLGGRGEKMDGVEEEKNPKEGGGKPSSKGSNTTGGKGKGRATLWTDR